MPSYTYNVPDGNSRAPVKLYAMQGEANARSFTLELGSSSISASEWLVYVLKNDHTVCVIDANGGTSSVTFTLPLQACTCPGRNQVVVQALTDSSDLRWDNIELWVQPCNLENAVASTDDLGPLANLITDPDYIQELENSYIVAKDNLDELMKQFAPKGEYSSTAAYKALNIVSQNGNSYVAIQDTQGNPPTDTTRWQLLAEKGQKGDPGESGPEGPPGSGLDIIDHYDSLEALQQAVPSPEVGSNYYVGTSTPYDVYTYTATNGWVNGGPLEGAKGDTGPYFTPSVSESGDLSWTNNGGLENPPTVNIRGPQGIQGNPGQQGEQGETGPAPDITIGSVTTLNAGQNATASITGTTPNLVLNLGLPRGDSGVSNWSDIEGKPSEFPPEDHTQAISTITGLQSQLNSINSRLPSSSLADYIIYSGSSGIWRYSRWYSGRLHVWGNIPVSSVAVTSTLGNMYRSGNAFSASSYRFPQQFIETPTISMTFLTTNSSSAFVWPNPSEISDLLYYPCNCYLVRPTSGTVSGYVCYDAWGYYT